MNNLNTAPMEGAAAPLTPQEEQRLREEELARREKEVSVRELRAAALEALAEADMPAELAQILVYDNEEAMRASLETVKAVFARAVHKGVAARIAGSAPKAGAAHPEGTLREAIADHYKL